MLETCRRILVRSGKEVEVASSAREAEQHLANGSFELMITDLVMPETDGITLARRARKTVPGLTVLVITAHATAESALQATREGACDFIKKPFTVEEFEVAVERGLALNRLRGENERLKQRVEAAMSLARIVGNSPAMRGVHDTIRRVAATDASVLLTGESGTGKELIARAIHENSERKARAFVPVDCAALPETLLESELFGAERGSYTGAVESRVGVFEAADHGTLFLDEISNLPIAMQVKLLRVLQERSIRRIGGVTQIGVDVRIVAASNQDLAALVRDGQFRSDLFYRLNVVPIEVPPLRDRAGDIELLAQHMVIELARRHDRPVHGLSNAALMFLERYDWPGNVRELRNVLERAVLLSESNQVMPDDLPTEIIDSPGTRMPAGDFNVAKRRVVVEFEIDYLTSLLKQTDGNISKAAALAGLQRTALHRLLQRHGLRAEDYRQSGS
jgi:DNA-binding NtrC family response regulator